MNRTYTIRTAALIALPFLLLPAGVWLVNTAAELWHSEVAWFYPWQAVRWLMRFAYVGGAFMGWRAGRPIWFYPWLGFAVYELVAVLMLLASGPLVHLWVTHLGGWPHRYSGRRALYVGRLILAIFCGLPLAGQATIAGAAGGLYRIPLCRIDDCPLYLSAVTAENVGGTPGGMIQSGMEGMPPLPQRLLAAVFAAICAVLFWRQPLALSRGRVNGARMVVLFGGVPLSHFLFCSF